MTPEDIKQKYADRIMALLRKIQSAIAGHGFQASEPEDWSGDDYAWGLIVRYDEDSGKDPDDFMDLTFKLCESEQCDGSYDGVTFRIDLVHAGGAIVGELAPMNYSPACWVYRKDTEAVEERFKLLEDHDVCGWPNEVTEYLEARKRKARA